MSDSTRWAESNVARAERLLDDLSAAAEVVGALALPGSDAGDEAWTPVEKAFSRMATLAGNCQRYATLVLKDEPARQPDAPDRRVDQVRRRELLVPPAVTTNTIEAGRDRLALIQARLMHGTALVAETRNVAAFSVFGALHALASAATEEVRLMYHPDPDAKMGPLGLLVRRVTEEMIGNGDEVQEWARQKDYHRARHGVAPLRPDLRTADEGARGARAARDGDGPDAPPSKRPSRSV